MVPAPRDLSRSLGLAGQSTGIQQILYDVSGFNTASGGEDVTNSLVVVVLRWQFSPPVRKGVSAIN